MNASMIEVTEQEITENFDFCMSLVERGNTLKIVREGGNVLMVPIPDYKQALDDIQSHPPIPSPSFGGLPVDPSEFVDPIATSDYVREELSKMQTELES